MPLTSSEFKTIKTHRNQVAALPGSSNGCATRERSSEGKMGSQDGLLCTALPPNLSLSLLSVVTTAPTSTSFAAPQSQGRPLLGQICRVVHFSHTKGQIINWCDVSLL